MMTNARAAQGRSAGMRRLGGGALDLGKPRRGAVRARAFELKPPPFELDALEPYGMSKETLEYHWGKHQATYVNNLNAAVSGTPDESKSLVDIMMMAVNEKKAGLFNNSGQVFNHEFFWEGLTPGAQNRRARMPVIVSSQPGRIPSRPYSADRLDSLACSVFN